MRRGALISLVRDTSEMEELCRSAGIDVLYEVVQRRSRPDQTYYLGKGRFNALRELLDERPVDVLVVNGDLKPSQHFNLESCLKVECLDRVAVVLDIFAGRAEGREAELQVELARLHYQIPLMREWVHCAKAGEHPGFLGGGEYQVDVYYNLIRRRMAQVEEELRRLARDDDARRGVRRHRGYRTVCLAGYTNAGKSSLMNKLTGEELLVADRMFSTLRTTTRRVGSSKILMTDTIGFLKDLPPYLVESFRNTLQDVFTADLVLLVIDSSEPLKEMESKLYAVQDVLGKGFVQGRIMAVLNKVDKGPEDLEEKISSVNSIISPLKVLKVSAITSEGLEGLMTAIESFFRPPLLVRFKARYDERSVMELSRLYDDHYVELVEYDDVISVTFRCHERELKKVMERLRSLSCIMDVSFAEDVS